MTAKQILLIFSNTEVAQLIESTTLQPAGYETIVARDTETAQLLVTARVPDLAMIGHPLPATAGENSRGSLELAAWLLERHPALPVLLLAGEFSEALAGEAMRLGLSDLLTFPLKPKTVLQSVRHSIHRSQRLAEWAGKNGGADHEDLQERVHELEALERIGQAVTASLDLDHVLAAVVDAAVALTGAEEGSILLLDEPSGELYMRAARNFREDFVRTFRLPAKDTLPGQVLRTGKPVILQDQAPQKIKTAYLVRSVMYVPMVVHERVIGVLGVDNRQDGRTFLPHHLSLATALADYAAIAVENARLFSHSEIERTKLETILTRIQDGVIVVDRDGRVALVNRTARDACSLPAEDLAGRPVQEVIPQTELLEVLADRQLAAPTRTEVTLKDGRVFIAQAAPIPDVGLAVTLHDITHLKELDRIKSDFVNTVSHDLRSPLTAILGYIELLDRVGPVNAQQGEFIRRVQGSVHNITALINDLLDLGRIEAGFDARKELVPLGPLIHYTADELHVRVEEKDQRLVIEAPSELPPVLGIPIRLRQLVHNLIENALKYTQPGGRIMVKAWSDSGQIIFQVSDNGPGIPPNEQSYIFDKFYRASSAPADSVGTGLGLAIVKSIVETHQGRVWVDSIPGKGTAFTVILPVA